MNPKLLYLIVGLGVFSVAIYFTFSRASFKRLRSRVYSLKSSKYTENNSGKKAEVGFPAPLLVYIKAASAGEALKWFIKLHARCTGESNAPFVTTECFLAFPGSVRCKYQR